ncbi:MAG: CHASE2 domain-containing protein, partial [Gammaproteobacteria bacterium]
MTEGLWRADWMTGLLVALLVIGSGLLFDTFQGVELAAYDFGVRHNTATPSDDIVIIAIDDASIERLGRWPWPRTLHAQLLDRLREGGARVVATTVAFTEPQRDPGLDYLQALLRQLRESSIVTVDDELRTLDERLRQLDEANARLGRKALPQVSELRQYFLASKLRNRLVPDINALARKLIEAEQALETDRQLARSIQQNGRVLMNMFVFTGVPRGNPEHDLPPYIKRNALTHIEDRIGAIDAGLLPPAIIEILPPIPQLGSKANGIGYLGAVRDIDGTVRSDALVMH